MEVPEHLYARAQEALANESYAAGEQARPSILLRPALYKDGDQWCALFGNDIQCGVCGFGDSPDKAYRAFDAAWFEKLPQATTRPGPGPEEGAGS